MWQIVLSLWNHPLDRESVIVGICVGMVLGFLFALAKGYRKAPEDKF